MTALAHAPTFRRAGLPRLSQVELRKTADTRAGFWLLLIIELMAAAIVTITLFAGKAADKDLASLFQGTIWVVSILLPVLGILLVTSEWSQRTGLTTFALIHAIEKPAKWLDTSQTMQPLVDGGMNGTAWAQLGTSMALWLGVVALIGLWRLRRTELK